MKYNQLHYPTGYVKVSKFCFGVMRKALLKLFLKRLLIFEKLGFNSCSLQFPSLFRA
jgi:hypothetical protein